MDKGEKLRALLSIASGKPVSKVFKEVEVFVIESDAKAQV